MSRPTKEESVYKVSIHKNGGYMYAATHPYTIDENGKRKYVYRHWGIVDENKKFIPGKRYVFASLEERAKLVFPDDWGMSEAKTPVRSQAAGAPCIYRFGQE